MYCISNSINLDPTYDEDFADWAYLTFGIPPDDKSPLETMTGFIVGDCCFCDVGTNPHHAHPKIEGIKTNANSPQIVTSNVLSNKEVNMTNLSEIIQSAINQAVWYDGWKIEGCILMYINEDGRVSTRTYGSDMPFWSYDIPKCYVWLTHYGELTINDLAGLVSRFIERVLELGICSVTNAQHD